MLDEPPVPSGMQGRKDMRHLKIYTVNEIRIRIEEILRYLAYKKEENELPSSLKKIIEQEIESAYSLIKPRALYSFVNNLSLKSHHMFENAKKIVLGVCTIGSELETQVDKHFKEKNYLEGMVLDAIGTVAVQSLVELVAGEIKENVVQQGFCISNRLGPGYGNWPLEDQHILFSHLSQEDAGVKINGSGIMTPRKSISFAYKIGRENMDKSNYGNCHSCHLSDRCAYKKNHRQNHN